MTGTTIKGQIQREDLALFDGKTLVAQRPNSSGGTQTGNRMGDAVDVKLIHGGSANAASFQAAVDSMGTTNGALLFTPETWTIAANVTVPANITMIVPAGCVFSINSGITVTNNGILIRYHKTYSSGSGTFTQNGIDSLQTADQTDIFGTDTGSTNTYAITTVTDISSLSTGVTIRFEASSTNTGSCTLNVDGTGAKTLKPAGSSANMPIGSIQSGGIYTCVFDAGSNIWQVVNLNASVGEKFNLSNGDLVLSKDSALIKLGNDEEISIQHIADTGVQLSAGANITQFTVTTTEAGPSHGPYINLTRSSGSPADADGIGIIQWYGQNDGAETVAYAQLTGVMTDVSAGSDAEVGKLVFKTKIAGTASATTALELQNGRINSGAYLPAGTIVQTVVSAAATSHTNSTSYVDVTNATILITPASSSNKIFLIFNSDSYAPGVSGHNMLYTQQLYRTIGGSGKAVLSTRYLSAQSSGGGLGIYGSTAHAVLDAPNTTSEINYKVEHKVSNTAASGYTNSTGNYIIAMEVQV
jgi:hypothetical protein